MCKPGSASGGGGTTPGGPARQEVLPGHAYPHWTGLDAASDLTTTR